MKNDKHSYQTIYQTLPALLILLTIYTVLAPENASAQNSIVSKTEADNQDFFGERFREGRDLIDKQEWAQATEKFRAAVGKYPDHKRADAALYWLAFCYKKQKKYQEADVVLASLLEKFPASSWTSDARVMKVEIAPWIGRLGVLGNDNINSNVVQGKFSSDQQADIVKGTVNTSGQKTELADKLAMNDRLPPDRADELKIAAFQSLLVADPKRAIETMGEVLKPDSKASEVLKRKILRVWTKPRFFASKALVSDINKTIGSREFVSLLRETLVKSFQNEKSLKIRIEIIYTLANLADGQSLNYLKQLYATEIDRDIKKDIINAFGNSATIFDASDVNVKQKPKAESDASREQIRKIEIDFLLEIVRAEKDIELRRLAFSNLRLFQDWWTISSAQAVEVMTSLYDAETNEEFKILLIRALAESKESQAARKLFDIANNDKSDKLRLEAIYSLRTSKDPEVIKFLEDLIK